jgi:hypothetical protein
MPWNPVGVGAELDLATDEATVRVDSDTARRLACVPRNASYRLRAVPGKKLQEGFKIGALQYGTLVQCSWAIFEILSD